MSDRLDEHDRPHSVPRRYHPTAAQYRAQRNACWLSAIEYGMQMLPDKDFHSVTVADIAGIWQVTSQCVLNGLASAIVDRNAIVAARRDEDEQLDDE